MTTTEHDLHPHVRLQPGDFPAPVWLEPFAKKCAAALGLQAWKIDVWLEEHVYLSNDPEHERPMGGSCEARWQYLSADITLRYASVAEDTVGARGLVAHEFTHVAFDGLDEFTNHMINMTIPGQWRKQNAQTAWEIHREQMVERLGRRIALLVSSWDGAEDFAGMPDDEEPTDAGQPDPAVG
jgi:hypothetical protein